MIIKLRENLLHAESDRQIKENGLSQPEELLSRPLTTLSPKKTA